MFDFTFEKRSSGVWIDWMDTVDNTAGHIPPNATVCVFFFTSCLICVQHISDAM